MTRFSPAEDLAERLIDHLDDLVPSLLPTAICNSSHWYAGSVDGEPGDSLKVNRRGAWKGSWIDYARSPHDGGDLLDLVRLVHGLDMRSAMDWARNYLGLSSNSPVIDQAVLERRRAEREAQAVAEDEEKIAKALALWKARQPIFDTPAAVYLEQVRGIPIGLAGALGFHPGLKDTETGVMFPALLAPIASPWGLVACQFLLLRPDGLGKAPVSTPKKVIGRFRDGAVRLAPVGPTMAIAEGTETALSVTALSGIGCWASCGRRMDKVAIPTNVERLLICGDNDAPGREHVERAAKALSRRGLEIQFGFPSVGKDFNDQIMAMSRSIAA